MRRQATTFTLSMFLCAVSRGRALMAPARPLMLRPLLMPQWRSMPSPLSIHAKMLATSTAQDLPDVPKNADGVPIDENGAPLSKNALKKLAKAAATAAKKAAKAAEKAATAQEEQSAAAVNDDGGVEPDAPYSFVDPGVLMSSATPADQQRVYSTVPTLGAPGGVQPGGEVWVRGRLSKLRAGSNNCFLVLRAQGQYTVQACFFRDKSTPKQSRAMLDALAGLTEESIVDVRGQLVAASVTGCSQSTVEIQLQELVLISQSLPKLPFEIDEAGRSEAEIVASEGSERPLARIGQDLRLNARWIDLRVPASQAIMRTQSAVCTLWREALTAQGFVEIHTPKLIAGESEGGSDVFRTDYFGSGACLAQSPQLYKQMAIASDLERVFEIGPVFRAEKSNTRRHLCEFVGLDMEMAFNLHYNEVIAVLHDVFAKMFDGLETRYAVDLATVRAQVDATPSTPPPAQRLWSHPLLPSTPNCVAHSHVRLHVCDGRGSTRPRSLGGPRSLVFSTGRRAWRCSLLPARTLATASRI